MSPICTNIRLKDYRFIKTNTTADLDNSGLATLRLKAEAVLYEVGKPLEASSLTYLLTENLK